MELLNADLPKTHRIVFAGDLHFGSLAFHEKGWVRLLERLQQETGVYLVLMGDLLEAITVDDPRWNSDVHDGKMTPLAQADMMIDYLKPVRKKILALLTGNHEAKLWRYGDLTQYMCGKLDVPYGGYSCKIAVKNGGRLRYKLYATHGRLTVNSIADDPVRRLSNFRLTIKRKLQHLAGDTACMVTGHCHKLLTCKPVAELYVTDDGEHLHASYTQGVQTGGYIDPNLRWYGASGSFMKSAVVGATTYSEQAMYAPNQMGYLVLHSHDGKVQRLEEVRI